MITNRHNKREYIRWLMSQLTNYNSFSWIGRFSYVCILDKLECDTIIHRPNYLLVFGIWSFWNTRCARNTEDRSLSDIYHRKGKKSLFVPISGLKSRMYRYNRFWYIGYTELDYEPYIDALLTFLSILTTRTTNYLTKILSFCHTVKTLENAIHHQHLGPETDFQIKRDSVHFSYHAWIIFILDSERLTIVFYRNEYTTNA